MDGGGFEPPKQFAADLQSVPFGHSGIHPYGIVFHKADDRTRTDNLLITNQLLCQLSHIGVSNGTYRARTYDPLLVRQMLSQLSYDPIQTTQKRLELSTSAVTGRRSNQLSHWAIKGFAPSKLHTC